MNFSQLKKLGLFRLTDNTKNKIDSGTFDTPFASPSEATTTGVFYIKPAGFIGDPFQTYFDVDTGGGPWALAWVVTNAEGDGDEWWNGDTSMSGATGTNHFTTVSTLGSTTSPTSKLNAKNPLFDYHAFSSMMIVENHNGTTGTKRYAMTSSDTFRGHFSTQSGANLASSVIGSTGSFTTFNTSNLYFNYVLNNDGARIAAAGAVSEAVGGISARVDGGRSYSWKGNLTRNDPGRNYGSDGTTTDHTVWIYVN